MRRALGAAALLVALAVAAPAHAAADYVSAPGGPFMTDAQGRRLELHGVNLVPKCAAQTSPAKTPGTPCLPDLSANEPNYVLTPDARDPGRRFTAQDAATLRGLGVSVVRVGIIWQGLEPGPAGVRPDDPRYCSTHLPGTPFASLGAADPYDPATVQEYLSKVDTTVNLLAAQGIRVFIDMHQDAWGSAFANPGSKTPWMGEGAPPWATCTSGAPFRKTDNWQGAYQDPAPESAFSHFFSNDVSGDLQGQYQRVWRDVAAHFATNPTVIGYEIVNEPADPTLLAEPEFDRRLECFYAGSANAPASCAAAGSQAPAQGMIPVVQAAAPNQLVFYEAPVLTDFGAPDSVGVGEPLPFGRLVLSFHDYGFTSGNDPSFRCADPSCTPEEEAVMSGFSGYRAATRTSQAGGPAWILSEFGAEDYVPDVRHMVELADRNLVSWAYWSALQLHDPTGGPTEALIDETTRKPDPARAAVLARPYPLATAGTPQAQSYSPESGAFDMSYSADPAVHAPTEVVVPTSWAYPFGYRASATGARVSSAPDAGMLTLQNAPGSGTVSLHLRRVGNPLGLPRSRGCVDRRRFRFRIHQPRHGSIVKVEAFVGRRVVARRKGDRIVRLTLRRLPQGRFRVKIVATASNGQRTVSARSYRGCRKSRPRTRVQRRHRRHRRT